MVASYIEPPPPKDVSEARRLVHAAVDRLSYANIRALAAKLLQAEREILASDISTTRDRELRWKDCAAALKQLAPCESVPPALRPLMLQAAEEIEVARAALRAADALAHQSIHSDFHELYWQARGGHSKCTVCAQSEQSPESR